MTTSLIVKIIICLVVLYCIILEYMHKKKAKKEHIKAVGETIIAQLGDTDYITKFMTLAEAGYTGEEIIEVIGECP